jgi:glycosyltransferase involved in cell wall biosynthesis
MFMSKMKKIFLSVIIPCYNESRNLKGGVLTTVVGFLNKQKFTWEIIVSDDGSTDDSLNLIKDVARNKESFRVLANEHGGKPYALWRAIKEARGEYVLFDDMDQSTPISEFEKMLPYLSEGEAVIGSRGIKRENYSLLRRLGSAVFLLLRKLILLRGIDDTQCGFKVFETRVVREIFPLLEFFRKKSLAKGWKVTSYDVELLFLMEKRGYRIREVPVKWRDEDKSIGKQRNYFKESKEMLLQILRVKLNDQRGFYDRKNC